MDHKNKPPVQATMGLRRISTQAYPALIGLEAANDPDNGESPAQDHAVQPLQSVPTDKSNIHQLRVVK